MKYGFGADVGGTTVKLGFFDENGTLLVQRELPSRTEHEGEAILPDIAEAVREICAERGLSKDELLGIGIGGDFEQVAENAKRALMLPLGTPNPDPFYAQLEEELLEAINQTGIGVQGLGGRTTCLGLHIIAAPTHIAGLPVAVNVSCHVTRHATAVL